MDASSLAPSSLEEASKKTHLMPTGVKKKSPFQKQKEEEEEKKRKSEEEAAAIYAEFVASFERSSSSSRGQVFIKVQ